MEGRRKSMYPSAKQKQKLIELLAKHPELITCRVTQDFNYKDSQTLWHKIANECNAIPGAKKTWKQWRKTWQDFRCHAKRQQKANNGQLPTYVIMLSTAEQEALGLKNESSADYQDATELIPANREEHNFDNHTRSPASLSEPESPPEQKVFARPFKTKKYARKKNNAEHSNNCIFNCDILATQEQKKLQIKEDYYSFKKDYLKQKLLMLREQTDALKNIAKELAK